MFRWLRAWLCRCSELLAERNALERLYEASEHELAEERKLRQWWQRTARAYQRILERKEE